MLKKKNAFINLLEALGPPERKLYIGIKRKMGITFQGFQSPEGSSDQTVSPRVAHEPHPGWYSSARREAENTHVVQRDGLHHLVLLHGVHLIQVTISDKNGAVFHLTEPIDLQENQPTIVPSHEA